MEIDISPSHLVHVSHPDWAQHVLGSLLKLRGDTVLCDTTVMTDDGGSFQAHSNVLAACSPILKSSFPAGGNQEFLVPLHGVSSTTTSLLLDFLYTGQINCDGAELVQLMVYAEQLEIPGVMEAITAQQQDPATDKTGTATAEPRETQVQDASVQVGLHTADATDAEDETPDAEPSDSSSHFEDNSVVEESQPAAVSPPAGDIKEEISAKNSSKDEKQSVCPPSPKAVSLKRRRGRPRKDEKQSVFPSSPKAVSSTDQRERPSLQDQSVRRSSRAMKKSEVFSEYEMQRKKKVSAAKTVPTSEESEDLTKNGNKTEIKEIKVEADSEVTEKKNTTEDATDQNQSDTNTNNELSTATSLKELSKEQEESVTIQVKKEPGIETETATDAGTLPVEKILSKSSSAKPQKSPKKPFPRTGKKRKRGAKQGSNLAKDWMVSNDVPADETEKDPAEKPPQKKMRKPRIKKEKQPCPCDMCGKIFRCPSALNIHLMRHKQIRPWQCDGCEKAFITKSSLQIHQRIHTGEKPHVCQYCGQKFSDPSAWRGHERKHRTVTEWPCTLCSFKCETKRLLVRHQKTHHGGVDTPLRCSHCNKGFMKEFELKIHERMHSNGLVCNMCGKSFARRSGFEIHLRWHRGEKPFRCEYCDQSYASEVSLKSHVKKHTDGFQFSCEYCPRKFYRKWECDVHERTHTRERPYKCDFCGKTYRGLSHLRVHERTHTGVKPYQCKICPFRFTSGTALKRHEVTHTDIRPFPCQECGKLFRRSTHLRSHLKTHVGLEQLARDAAKAHVQQVSGEEVVGIVSSTDTEVETVQEVNAAAADSNVQEIHEIRIKDLEMGEITVEEVHELDSPVYIQVLNI